MVLLVRSVKERGRDKGDFRVAEYPWSMKIIILLFSGVIGVLTYESIVDTQPLDALDWITMVVLNILAIVSLLEFFVRRINYTDKKMISYSPWTGVREFNFSDFTSASYSGTLQWHKLTTYDNRFVYIHDYLSGSLEIVSIAFNELEPVA